MKKLKRINRQRALLPLLLLCGIVGLILSAILFFSKPAPTYASATLVFTFEGATNGIAPNGQAYDVKDILLDEVLSDGLRGASLEATYTPEQIRPSLVVSGIYPEDMADQVTRYESLLNFTASRELSIGDYHPTTFHIALYNDFDKSISKSNLTALLGSILDTYRAYFSRAYAFGLDTDTTLFSLDEYDYPQQLQIIEGHLTIMSKYALELYEFDPSFRSGGAGFNDISVRLNTLIESSINRLNAELTINALTKNRARQLNQYQFEIESLQNRLEKQKEELGKLDALIDSYEKNEIIYLRTTDALTKIDGNSSQTYDTLTLRRKTVADGITEINYEITNYKQLLNDLLEDKATQTPTSATTGTATDDGSSSPVTVTVLTDAQIAAAAAEAERVKTALQERLESEIDALILDTDAILTDFKALIQAYNSYKINDLTVTVTRQEYSAPSILSGAFIKKAILTAGPLVALGFIVGTILIIIDRKREEARIIDD